MTSKVSSYQKFLEQIQTNIKRELSELDKFVEIHSDSMSEIKIPDGSWFVDGRLINHKIQKTSERLMEQLDVLIQHSKKRKDVPVHNNMGSPTPSPKPPKAVRRGRPKGKASS